MKCIVGGGGFLLQTGSIDELMQIMTESVADAWYLHYPYDIALRSDRIAAIDCRPILMVGPGIRHFCLLIE
jgi:hypothetical protein